MTALMGILSRFGVFMAEGLAHHERLVAWRNAASTAFANLRAQSTAEQFIAVDDETARKHMEGHARVVDGLNAVICRTLEIVQEVVRSVEKVRSPKSHLTPLQELETLCSDDELGELDAHEVPLGLKVWLSFGIRMTETPIQYYLVLETKE